jgi:Skp family chaperone for outer membrane proteins
VIRRFLLLAYAPAAMAPSVSAAANAVVEVTLPQAAADLAAAQAELEAREAKIQSEIARNEAALAALRKKYKNRRGRYPNPDGKNKSKADANRAGRLPEEVRAANRAQHERIKNAPKPAASATSHAAHHAAAPDGRRSSGGGAAAAASAAPRGGQAAVDAAARGGGPDDEENDALPEGVDKRYFSASAAQQAFFAEVLPEALAGRGGRHLGSGYYAYTPPGCVELGCRCCRVCCRPTERGRGGCATKRSPRRVPRSTRGRTLACTDCSSNLACGGQITITVSDDNLGCAVHE